MDNQKWEVVSYGKNKKGGAGGGQKLSKAEKKKRASAMPTIDRNGETAVLRRARVCHSTLLTYNGTIAQTKSSKILKSKLFVFQDVMRSLSDKFVPS